MIGHGLGPLGEVAVLFIPACFNAGRVNCQNVAVAVADTPMPDAYTHHCSGRIRTSRCGRSHRGPVTGKSVLYGKYMSRVKQTVPYFPAASFDCPIYTQD